jgi:hypothetical protein
MGARADEPMRHDRRVDEHRQAILDEIAGRLGEPGVRARDFLLTADALVGPLSGSTPKGPELAAYSLREALTSITAGIGVAGSRFRTVSREVVTAFDAAQGAPGDAVAAANLQGAIEDLRAFGQAPAVHESRMIELIMRRTGNEPLRLAPDPVAEYQHLVELAARSLHSSAEDAARLLEDAFDLLGRLFAPSDAALADLDRFIAITEPTPEDAARLSEHLISAAHLRYFTERAGAPGWLELLRGSPLAQPSERWAGWPIGELAVRIAAEDPDLAASWLNDAVSACPDLTPNAAFHFARTAAGIGATASTVLVDVARRRPADPSVRAFADQLLTGMPPDEPTVLALSDVYLNDPMDEWFAGELLKRLAAGVTQTNFADRLELLGHKLRRQERDQPMTLDVSLSNIGPAAELTITDELLGGAQYLIAGAVSVIRQALNLDVGDGALEALGLLPSPVSDRLRAWLLGAEGLGSTEDAIQAITDAIALDGPSEDHIAVVDRCWTTDPEAAAAAWSAALGEPPSDGDLDDWMATRENEVALWRVRAWSSLLPSPVVAPWRNAAEAVAGRPVPDRGSLGRTGIVESGWGRTPIPVEELAAVAPLEAAARVAAWRPTPEDFLTSPLELGRALEEVVSAAPGDWAAALPDVMPVLRHATYVAHMLSGLRKQAAAAIPFKNEVLDAVALVTTEPWPIVELDSSRGADFDNTWANARTEGRALLEAVAVAGVDVAEERPDLLELVLQDANDRGDAPWADATDNPALGALNRNSMKALQTAVVLGWRTAREGRPVPTAVTDLLDTVLALEGSDGLQARSVLAGTLDHIREMDPAWFAEHQDLLFGDAAPADLGQRTVDFSLNRTSVEHWMLVELRTQIYQAATNDVPNGKSHVLIAMVHDVDGYSITEVADWMSGLDPTGRSDTLSTLGHLLRNEERADVIDRAVALVEELQGRQLEPGSFEGLGSWWGVKALDQGRWTALMLAAASSGTALRSPMLVAQHAIIEVTSDTFELLELLLVNAKDLWEPGLVATEAIKALREHADPSDQRASLRTTLLDRGYFHAQDL